MGSSSLQGSNPGPLNWEHRVIATGPQGKSLQVIFHSQVWEPPAWVSKGLSFNKANSTSAFITDTIKGQGNRVASSSPWTAPGAQGLLCQPFSSRWVGQVYVAVSSCETELQIRSISQGASVKHSLRGDLGLERLNSLEAADNHKTTSIQERGGPGVCSGETRRT